MKNRLVEAGTYDPLIKLDLDTTKVPCLAWGEGFVSMILKPEVTPTIDSDDLCDGYCGRCANKCTEGL